MSDVVIVEEGDGEAIPDAPVEPVATVEAVADASVEIAEIEADRDIALAEIAQDARENEAEIIADAITEDVKRELEQCRQTIVTQETEMAGLREKVSTLETALALIHPPLEEVLEESLPVDESAGLMPDSLEEAAPEPPAPKRAKRLRWI